MQVADAAITTDVDVPAQTLTYSIVVSSTAIIPARAPASIDMLQTVMRPSIDRARIALPPNSIV